MENLYITKKCGCCGKPTKVNSNEYKQMLEKGNCESSEYIKLNKFLFINIDQCSNCGYCSMNIESEPPKNFTKSENYKNFQEYSQSVNGQASIYALSVGGYMLMSNNDLFNASKAFLACAKKINTDLYRFLTSGTSEKEKDKYKLIFERMENAEKNAYETATTLAADCYAKTSNLDALVLLLYILKESNQIEQYKTLSELIFTLPLTDTQTELAKIITEQNE